MRHTKTHLLQLQSLPLLDKVELTKRRIRAWYEHFDGLVYVSFSGGKDSTVLKHIVDSMYDDVPSVYVNTGLEYPEVRRFALKQKNVIRVDPKLKFHHVVEKYGYPVISKTQAQYISEARRTKSDKLRRKRLYGDERGLGKIAEKWKPLIEAPFLISDRCCHKLKKDPVKRYEKETGRHPMVGNMTVESSLREERWFMHGCNAFALNRPISTPIAFWTEQDILAYIFENKLEIPSVYGEVLKKGGEYINTGLDRTGCMFCMFGVHLEKAPNRFQQMKKTHPKQHEYCINNLGVGKVLDYIGIKYE